MKANQPDWKGFEEKLRSIAGVWIPTKHFQKCPIRIAAMKKVHFADVLRCVLICRNAAMGDIKLGLPAE